MACLYFRTLLVLTVMSFYYIRFVKLFYVGRNVSVPGDFFVSKVLVNLVND